MELIDYTMGEMLNKWASETPNQEFLVFPDRGLRFTYEQFQERVDNLSRSLIEIGVTKGSKVGVWATNVPEWLIVLFATAKIGGVLVTVNTNYQRSEVEYIIKNADIHTMCIINGYRDSDYVQIMYDLVPELKKRHSGGLKSERFPELRNVVFMGSKRHTGMYSTEVLMRTGAAFDSAKLIEACKQVNTHDEVNMQYTSGTTGFPKGVMLTHHNILNNGLSTGRFMEYTSEDKLLVCVPLFHCFGCVLALCAVLTHGATMVMVEEFDPLKVLASIHKERCTILYGVPTMFIAELSHPMFDMFDLTSLRTGIMAGAVCPIETMKQVMDRMHCNVISVYGLTETSPGMTATRISDTIEARATTVGTPYHHVDVKVLDLDTGEECPTGVQGEMCCKGYNLMKGYYNNPVSTAEVIDENGYLHSGDLGVKDENGYFHITGRIKELIIRGGENISPREIENFLYNMSNVESVEIVGIPSPKFGEQVGAFIKVKRDENMTEEEVALYCKGRIARYKTPKYIFFVDKYPMTASGKIQKFRLRELGLELLEKANVKII